MENQQKLHHDFFVLDFFIILTSLILHKDGRNMRRTIFNFDYFFLILILICSLGY